MFIFFIFFPFKQEKGIVEQLSEGIRYFDLRIAHKPYDPSNELYFTHVIYTHLTVVVSRRNTIPNSLLQTFVTTSSKRFIVTQPKPQRPSRNRRETENNGQEDLSLKKKNTLFIGRIISHIFNISWLVAVQETLRAIASWLESHSKEVVILACSHFEGLTEKLHEHLIFSLKKIFGSKLCPRKVSFVISITVVNVNSWKDWYVTSRMISNCIALLKILYFFSKCNEMFS